MIVTVFGVIAAVVALHWMNTSSESDEELQARAQRIFSPIESAEADSLKATMRQREIGKALFFDIRLSKGSEVSCASCHKPEGYFSESTPHSIGVGGQLTSRNTLSVLNLKYHRTLHWRDDRESLEDQARRSLTDAEGLGNANEAEALKKLRQIYGSKMTLDEAASALAAFQRSLVATGSPFDRFLEGDNSALSADQKNGLRRFLHLGCVSCHGGVALGARGVMRFGLSRDYWEVTGSKPGVNGKQDFGRMDVTGNSNDRNVFKIPSLRNVAMTAPYFHDGSAKDLATAIRWMGELQLDRKLTDREVSELKSFLESLTGTVSPP